MAEETITYDIRFSVQGVNESVRSTQRLLFFANAVRLSIQDIQQLRADFSIGQLLWTTIQLTRAWTSLHRIIKAVNADQKRSGVTGALGQAVRGRGAATAVGGFASGQTTLGGTSLAGPGFISSLAAIFGVSIAGLAGLTGGALFGVGLIALKHRQVTMQRDWRERQREVARSQGLEF